MVIGASVALEDSAVTVKKKSVGSKKNGAKIHKKLNKAEREKLKRDHMNALFWELSKAIEPENQSNGKSCTLTDTIRILHDLFTQVDCLKKENAALLSESQYITGETNELKEENFALESQIGKLKKETEISFPVFVEIGCFPNTKPQRHCAVAARSPDATGNRPCNSRSISSAACFCYALTG